MITLVFRTALIYIILILAVRLMGKRQIGELEISDFVTTLLISEIASLPITDNNIPISHAIIPIGMLVFFEVTSSVLIICFPRLKNLLTARPSTLVRNGQICRRAMRRARISVDELISELRQKEVTDLSEVLYAILEQNGKITVIPKAADRVPTARQLGLHPKENGICHIVIDGGVLNRHSMEELGVREERIEGILRERGLLRKEVYLMLMSDSGQVRIVKREENA